MTYSIKNEYQYPEESVPAIDNYIEQRVLAQIEWYDGKSAKSQKEYKRLTIISLIFGACIPILTLLLDYGLAVKIIISSLSAASSVLTSIIMLQGYKDLWVKYRTNCETLKSTLHRYKTRTGEFCFENDKSNFDLLVSICENHMLNEFQSWEQFYSSSNQSSTNS